MKHSFFLNSLVIFFVLLFVSCTGNDKDSTGYQQKKVSAEEMQPKIKFSLNPQLDKAYVYEMTAITGMEQRLKEEIISTGSTLQSNLTYLFTKDSTGIYQVNMQYNKFKLSIQDKNGERDIDAATAANSYDATEKIMGAFDHALLTLTIDSAGNVKSVTGIQALKNKMYHLGEGNVSAIQAIEGPMKQYLDENFFKQAAEQNFKFFTTRSLSIGDTVQLRNTIGNGFDVSITTVYKLITIEDNIAEIDVDADIDIKDQQVSVQGTPVSVNLTGEQSGSIKIDIKTGLQVFSSSDTKIKGTLVVKGTEVPLKYSIHNSVKLIQ